MGKLDKYKGLFANQGEFDIPENYGIGIALKTTPRLTLAADVEQINYSKIAAVGNPVDCLFQGLCKLGSNNGPGFGWRDVTALKLGASYQYRERPGAARGLQHLAAADSGQPDVLQHPRPGRGRAAPDARCDLDAGRTATS